MINTKETLSTEEAILLTMETPEGRKNAYLCYYGWDVKRNLERFFNSEEWKSTKVILDKFILPNKNVLDIGSGNGISSYAFTQCGFNVTAMEPDSSKLVGYGALKPIIDRDNLSIEQISALGENIPFPSSSFGIVYCRQVLHHTKSLQSAITEISRVLEPGGLFLCIREHVIDNDTTLKKFLANHPLHKFTHNENAYKISDYKKALKQANLKLFRVIGSFDSVINHYPLSDEEFGTLYKKSMYERFGVIGYLLVIFPPLLIIFRKWLASKDQTPGRMVSFVCIKRGRFQL